MSMLYIYIAGPYTKGDVAVNVRTAIIAADQLVAKGYIPYIPHLTHFWHLISPHDYKFWIAMDLEWLRKCDAVLRLPGDSDGADYEVLIAQDDGMPIFYSIEEFGVEPG